MKEYLNSNKRILKVLCALTVVILLALICVSVKYFSLSKDVTSAKAIAAAEAKANNPEESKLDGATPEKLKTLERWEYLRDTVKDAVENPRIEDAS